MGNLQYFLDSPKDNVYRQYLGQAELWCGGSIDCRQSHTLSTPIVDLPSVRAALLSDNPKHLHFTLSANGTHLKDHSIKMQKLEFKSTDQANLPIVDCRDLPTWKSDPGFKVMQAEIFDINKQNNSFGRFRFEYLYDYGSNLSDWCMSPTVYNPGAFETQRQVGHKFSIYWPSAWKKTGVCQ